MDDVFPATVIKLISGLINQKYPVSFIVIILVSIGALTRFTVFIRITRQQHELNKESMEEVHRKR